MNEETFSKYKFFFFIAFLIIALVFFSSFFGSGFGCADDFQSYLVVRLGRVWKDIVIMANFSGRFFYYLVRAVNYLPFAVDNMVYIKLFQLIPILFSFIVFSWLMARVTGSKVIGWFSLIIFFTASQGSTHTNLFYNYPFYFSFSFSLLLISIILLLDFYQKKRVIYLVISVVLFTVGLLFYETYLLFIIFIIPIIISKNIHEFSSWSDRLKGIVFQFLPYFCMVIVYLVVYLVFRHAHPSQYPGNQVIIGKTNVVTFFSVLWNLSVTTFPLTVYEANRWLCECKSELISGYSPVVIDLIFSAKLIWIIKGILISVCGYLLLTMMKGIKTRKFLVGICFAILLIFVPHIPLAISQKYTYYVVENHMQGYVTTFFSLFGTMMLITMIIAYLINFLNFNKWVKHGISAIFAFGFFLCSVLTDFTNYTIAKDIHSSNLRLEAVAEYVKSDTFKEIPGNAVLYVKDWYETPSFFLRGLTEQGFDWSVFIEAKTGTSPQVIRGEKEFLEFAKKTTQPLYYATMVQAEKTDDIMVVVAKIDPPGPNDTLIPSVTNKAAVAYYSANKMFTLNFHCSEGAKHDSINVKINSVKDYYQSVSGIEVNLYNTKKRNPATIFTIEAPRIDIKTLIISNMNNWNNKWIYL